MVYTNFDQWKERIKEKEQLSQSPEEQAKAVKAALFGGVPVIHDNSNKS